MSRSELCPINWGRRLKDDLHTLTEQRHYCIKDDHHTGRHRCACGEETRNVRKD